MPVATGGTFSESCDSYSYSFVTCLMYYYFLPKWTALFFSFSLYIHELYLIAITLNMPNYICILHCFVWGVFCFYYSSSWFVWGFFFFHFPCCYCTMYMNSWNYFLQISECVNKFKFNLVEYKPCVSMLYLDPSPINRLVLSVSFVWFYVTSPQSCLDTFTVALT